MFQYMLYKMYNHTVKTESGKSVAKFIVISQMVIITWS
jgi:hypothetical protein